MNAFNRISSALLLSASLAACSASMGGEDGVDPVNPGPEGTPDSYDIAGEYEVTSNFRITPERLGTSGDFALDFEELADDPIDALSGAFCDELGFGGACKFLVEPVIHEILGDRAQTLEDAVSDFMTASFNFELVSRMTLQGSGPSMTMTHAPTALQFTINGETHAYKFDAPKADTLESMAVAVSQYNLDMGSHDVEIPYSKMLITVLDEVLIPALDPDSNNLGDAFNHIVDCDAFGQKIGYTDIGFTTITPTVWASTCENALDMLALSLVSKLGDVETLTFAITLDGRGTAQDNNRDYEADVIEGAWESKFIGDIENAIDAPFEAVRQ